jgi:DNA gyrase subunit A
MRRTRFELREAQRRAEVLEGYLIALANLDEVIKIIRRPPTARKPASSCRLQFHPREVESFGIRSTRSA